MTRPVAGPPFHSEAAIRNIALPGELTPAEGIPKFRERREAAAARLT